MAANGMSLVETLLPSVVRAAPQRTGGSIFGLTLIKLRFGFLEQELAQAAGSADSLVGDMKLKVVYKGVTYESLSDEKFIKVAGKTLPTLPQLHDEYDAGQATLESDNLPLFDE